MVNMSAKFDQEAHKGLVAIVFTSSFPYNYVHCDLDLWPLTSKINRNHPLTMANMSAKFDKEIDNGLVSIMFTSLFPYVSTVTLTFNLWPPKSIGFILSSWLTCLPSLTKKHATVQSLSCSQGPCPDAHTRTRTEPQQRYYIPVATRCAGIALRGDN